MSTAQLSHFAPDEFVVVQDGAGEPQLSMLMPIYRQERYVDEAVRSVLRQEGIVCENIISDDASGDTTFERALAAVIDAAGATGTRHRIVMRRGERRLGRDHIHLLAAHAACDVVAQAHGDDIARPDRASRLLDAMGRTGAAMAASVMDVIDGTGTLIAPAQPDWIGDRMLSLDEVMDTPHWLVGASECWSRAALALFDPLDARTAPMGHDFIMPVRAWFAGGVVLLAEPLLRQRRHSENWSKALRDTRSADSGRFASGLNAMCISEVRLHDLTTVECRGLAPPDVVAHAREVLTATHESACRSMREATGALFSQGLLPLWVDDTELRLAQQGDLRKRLARKAWLLSPLLRAAEARQRLRARMRRVALIPRRPGSTE